MMMLRDQEFFLFSNNYLIESLFLAVVVDGLGFIFAVWRIGLSFLHWFYIQEEALQVLGYNYPFLFTSSFFFFFLHMVGQLGGIRIDRVARAATQGTNAGATRIGPKLLERI